MSLKNAFVHCPLSTGGNAFGGDRRYEILTVEGLWLALKNDSGEVMHGVHWANMKYTGTAVQQAQAVGAKEMLAWLISNAIDVSKADSPENFEELYRMFVKSKTDHRIKTWGQ